MKKTIGFQLLYIIFLCAFATPTPVQVVTAEREPAAIKNDSLPSAPVEHRSGFLSKKGSAATKEATYRLLDEQDRAAISANNKRNADPSVGKARAQEMMGMLQDQELSNAFEKITRNSEKTLKENSEIAAPLYVIAGAASLWYGRTLKLVRGDDFNLDARMEARARKGEFNIGSPLLNGRLQYDGIEGSGFGVNRRIGSIGTEAGVIYNTRSNVYTTEVKQQIAPNLNFSYGTSKIDQSSKIEYRFSF